MSFCALSPPSNSRSAHDGILIGDKVYSEVFLAIDSSIIPEERLAAPPSMEDGLDLHTETELRIVGCELIQSAGILLRLPQVAMATGQVLFHRFFYTKSFIKHNFEIVAMACMNLASKIEESPRRIRDVINVFHHLKQVVEKQRSSPLILDQNYINTKNQIIKAERRVLKELGFCVHVKHPHKMIFMYLQVLDCEKNKLLVQTAWNYMNDTLRTNVFVKFEPETIACACIYLAARVLRIPLPSRPHWFLLFGVTETDIREICVSTLKLYSRKKPNFEQLNKEVEKRKVFLEEAKLSAKGLNPSGTPATANTSSFSPASKPCTPREVKTEEKTPNTKLANEEEQRQDNSKSPRNGVKESRPVQNGQQHSHSRSRTPSPHRHRRSRSGTYSSPSSHSPSPRRNKARRSRSPPASHGRAEYRHGDKRRRSRSDSRERSRSSREYGKHKHDRSDARDYRRPREHDSRSKHQSRSHSGHSRHRR